MDTFTTYFISVVAGLTVAVIAKPGWLLISGLSMMIFSDLPKIAGPWAAQFTEPTEDKKLETMDENLNLHQLGRLVWGEGTIVDNRRRKFKYRGSILRNTFHGTYRLKKSTAPAGTGTFQLLISGNDKLMNGHCLWYDRDTDKIEASSYKWNKQDS